MFSVFNECIEFEIEKNFQVIIFDCQAGYSDFTRNIMSMSDTCLLISEPDSVSAAANKALCFQMGVEMQKIQSYQLFNKITEEEKEHYSKIATSAFFTNLPPIIFNWSVRTTFVYSQIPSDETVNEDFGKDILQILSALFPGYIEEISTYKNKLVEKQHIQFKEKIEILKNQEKRIRKNKILKLFQLLIPVLCSFITLFYLLLQYRTKDNLIIILTAFSVIFLLEVVLIFTQHLITKNQEIELEQKNLKSELGLNSDYNIII